MVRRILLKYRYSFYLLVFSSLCLSITQCIEVTDMCYFIVGRHEIKVLTHAAYLKGLFLSTMVFSERTSLFVTLLCYSIMGHHISADKVITSYSHVQCCVSDTEVCFLCLTFFYGDSACHVTFRYMCCPFKSTGTSVAADEIHIFVKRCMYS